MDLPKISLSNLKEKKTRLSFWKNLTISERVSLLSLLLLLFVLPIGVLAILIPKINLLAYAAFPKISQNNLAVIKTESLPDARVGQNYSATLEGYGDGDLSMKIQHLPEGLVQGDCILGTSETGTTIACPIEGVPQASGAYEIRVFLKGLRKAKDTKTLNLLVTPSADVSLTKKVMIIDFNPIIESQGNRKLTEVKSWNDPQSLEIQFSQEIQGVSGGYVTYQIVERQEVDDIPVKADGFDYTDESYLDCLANTGNCHFPDEVDYHRILADFDVCGRRNRDEINELWLWGGPYFGYYESRLAGPGAFWYNSPALTGTSCEKQLPIMGFNYERGIPEMLESFGHRVESVMTHLYGSWEPLETHAWNRFTLRDIDIPGKAACGNIHYAPNSLSDYDWSNQRTVSSSCEDWLNYPDLTGTVEDFNCERWGCDGYGFKKWWFSHLPKVSGQTDGKWNNWWRYILDFEEATK